MKAIELCLEIARLCKLGNEHQYAALFENYAAGLAEEKWDVMKRSIMNTFKGGMGSFNDLVLHVDGKPLFNENDRLRALKSQLYDEIAAKW